ncbi:hypothetical protein PIB30_105309 [Stylosanthes scabra]|uniref:Uncharacterized protein n=1 Tax=Stylosanthes scabra TaxID=79078 RepID=A0ABU6VYR2_9FABA|nr:hypothetical protein [Stylosanthes scabra]
MVLHGRVMRRKKEYEALPLLGHGHRVSVRWKTALHHLRTAAVGSPIFRGVGAVMKAWRMAWVEWVSVTAELACRCCRRS